MRRLRLFVSSPSDVMPERARVDAVAARLNGELEGLAQIEVVRWETGFYTADRSFQQAIDAAIGNMRGTDIVICILWKRVGSELDPRFWRRPDGQPYESGTVFEFETAVAVGRDQGAPDAYLFRKRAPITYAAESFETDRLQHRVLEAVWKRWTESDAGHNVAGYQRFDDADDFEAQFERCLWQWLERKGIIVRAVWDRARKGSPFRGLAAFESEHAPVFFGRELPLARAIARLRETEAAGTPFLLVLGASGVGKSSFLRAGLLPRITRPGTILGVDQWRDALIVPTGDPLAGFAAVLFPEEALGRELRAGDFRTPEALAGCLAAGGATALSPLRAALERAAKQRAEDLHYDEPRPARLLIAVDQVERLFIEAAPERVELFAEILRALVKERLAAAILALRSDAYAQFQQVAGFVSLLEEGGAAYNLLSPSPDELEDIVGKPVEVCQPPLAFAIDEGGPPLPARLVADAKGGDALPLLQMTLQRLYEAAEARGDGLLRAADYSGIDDAVARTAGEALATLSDEAKAELPALVTALVGDITQDPATGTLPVVVPLARTLFERGLASRRALIDVFIDRRLLTAEYAEGRERVRPTHDALLRTWPAAVRIIAEHAALIRVRHTLEPMAADWQAADAAARPGHLATSAALLAGAEQLLHRLGEDLPADMRAYIAAALAADAARRNAERRRHNRRLAATAGGLVIALILAGLAGWQWRVANREKAAAQHSLALATETANGLIFDLADKFRDLGLPAAIVKDILDRARKLQQQLISGGQTSVDLRRSQAVALGETAQSLFTIGDTKGALAAAQQAHHIFQALLAAAPGSSGYQHDLATSDERIGDVLQAQGDVAGALAAYRESQAIIKALARKDPGNTLWQSDLSVSDERIGDVLQAQGDLAGALAAYRDGLAIRKTLVHKDPGNTQWRRALAVSNERIGDILQAQGDLAGALAEYRTELAIMEPVAKKDPSNTDWQRFISVVYDKIGDVLWAQGDLAGALAGYREGLAIIKALARKDPSNTQWQRDLSASDDNIGDVLQAQGDLAGALAAYRDGLAIQKALSHRDPGNTDWQSDLSLSDGKIGEVLQVQSDLAGALAAYRDSLAIARVLVRKDPGNVLWQTDVVVSLYKLASAGVGARANLTEALAILKRLDAAGRLPPDKKGWIADIEAALKKT